MRTRKQTDQRRRFTGLLPAIIAVALVVACATPQPEPIMPSDEFGRDSVLQALTPPQGELRWLQKFGLVSTALSSSRFDWEQPLKSLDLSGSHGGQPFTLKLADGTLVEGLLFAYEAPDHAPAPLLMASFGFLQDRWGSEAAKFYDYYLKHPQERLPAHVLLLDHPTSGPFLANNGRLSIGSYDDARMWIEIAQYLQRQLKPSGIHLFGVSMSGQTVVHALIEDARLGLNLFDSGMAISIAPDFQQAPGRQLACLKTSPGVDNPWRPYFKGAPQTTLNDDIQVEALEMLIKNQFVPHYRLLHPTDPPFNLPPSDIAPFLRQACEDRLARLREQTDATWNPAFRLENLDAFMASSRTARVIGQVRIPLVLVSSLDDPAVPHAMFAELLSQAQNNPWVAACETPHGGHFGFDMVYTPRYLGNIMRLMITPKVLSEWRNSAQH